MPLGPSGSDHHHKKHSEVSSDKVSVLSPSSLRSLIDNTVLYVLLDERQSTQLFLCAGCCHKQETI